MCGVFGAYNPNGDSVLEDIYLGLHVLQHRGQLSAGVAWISDGSVHIKKGLGLVHEVLDQDCLNNTSANAAIGHVRYATSSGSGDENSQPLGVKYAQGPVAIAHNGNLTNFEGLSGYLEHRGAIFHTTSDTETILQLMAHQPDVVQLEALQRALKKVQGAYSLAVLFEDCLVAARDPWGFRPLVMGKKGDTVYISSESCALDVLGAETVRDVKPGEILIIDKRGIISRDLGITPKRHCRCSFEYVYFARPDSVIDGCSVYEARKKMGEKLAHKKAPENATVTGMPDSGTIAALGYAQQADAQFEMGVIRNRYVGRTFIQPTQRVRDAGVKIKLNPQSAVLEGKEVFVVDDSLVRGTTAKRIISMMRECGAEKVHMRIASPPVIFPCYYGIDTPSSDELAAAQMPVPELCEKISADSLEYLNCNDLAESIGLPLSELCTACFDGSYLDGRDFEDIDEI